MAREWPCLSDANDIVCTTVLVQAIRWRREDMAHHELDPMPGYEDAIAESLKHLSQQAMHFHKRGLLARLKRAFGEEEGLGYLRTRADQRLDPALIEGTWEQLVERLRAIFGDEP